MNAMIAISRFRPRRSEGEREPLMDVAFLGRSGEKCFIRRRGGEEVEVQGGGCGGGCDLGGGALGDEHAGEEEGEAQVGVLSRTVAAAAVGGGV
jgi:hypothetical protein